MDKEDNVGIQVKVDMEEMPKIGKCEVKTIIMDQCGVNILKDLDILILIFGKRQMKKQI